jgi:aerobic-type carbon monoxide dehydrogenase small subunit (CoxS/CutS family)
MKITLQINGLDHTLDVAPDVTLLHALRYLGFHGVKFGDEQGISGADTILQDGQPVNAGLLLAAQAEGHKIATIEALGEHPDQGWQKTGDCIPFKSVYRKRFHPMRILHSAQVLAAKALLENNPNPPKRKCGKRFQEYSADAQVTPSRYRLS